MDDNHTLLVESNSLPIWIVPTPQTDLLRSSTTLHVARMLAYWFSQFSDYLEPVFKALSPYMNQLAIYFTLPDDSAWKRPHISAEQHEIVPYSIDTRNNNAILISFHNNFSRVFQTDDNAGERTLMAAVMRSMADLLKPHVVLLPRELTDSAIVEAINYHAPLGQKKNLLMVDGRSNPGLDDRGLPSYRSVQIYNQGRIEDILGEIIKYELSVPTGSIPEYNYTTILNQSVASLASKLGSYVSSLSPDGLLEWLVAHHEQLFYQNAYTRLTIPTRIACYGQDSDFLEKTKQDLLTLRSTTIAIRFLIEYVTAMPPKGFRVISYSAYDHLIALSKRIVDLGYLSDYINYGLGDFRLQILESGRLGVDSGEFSESMTEFIQSHIGGEISRSDEYFHTHWRSPADVNGRPDLLEQLDTGAKAEFGRSFTNLMEFFAELRALAEPAEGRPFTIGLTDAQKVLANRLKWSREAVGQALGLVTLRPRTSFWDAEGYQRADIYPWRYNRSLSYMRRPVLLTRDSTGKDSLMWGSRHIESSAHYYFDLIWSGRLKAQSETMKAVIGRIRMDRGRAFNDEVGDVFEMMTGVLVKRRVRKVGSHAIERSVGQPLGDIDVLVAKPAVKEILVVETKNLSMARTPPEIERQIRKTFSIGEKTRSDSDRLLERAQWTRANIVSVLEWLELSSWNPNDWTVKPLMVVDHELISPFLARVPFRVMPIHDVRADAR